MTPIHQTYLTSADLKSLETVAGALAKREPGDKRPPLTEVMLPVGKIRDQGRSPRCTAEAVLNVVESYRAKYGAEKFPEVPVLDLYFHARAIDGMKMTVPGVWMHAAAEAYCKLAGTGIKWMTIPCNPEIFAQWITVTETGVAFAMRWDNTDIKFSNNRVLLPANDNAGADWHSVAVHGWQKSRAFKSAFWRRKTSCQVIAIETSNNGNDAEWFLPAPQVMTRGFQAVVFLKD